MRYPALEYVSVTALRPYDRNARTHSRKQIRQIANSIARFGFTNPVLISDDGQIIAGHGRVEAAKLLQIERVPTLCLSHLSDAERLGVKPLGTRPICKSNGFALQRKPTGGRITLNWRPSGESRFITYAWGT